MSFADGMAWLHFNSQYRKRFGLPVPDWVCAFEMSKRLHLVRAACTHGLPFADNKPLNAGAVDFAECKPLPPPAVHNFDPPPLPEWDGPVEVVFSITEESNAGGSSHCWVERRGEDYILFGNELGPMGEPCSDAVMALCSSGTDFGMDYVEIESTLSKRDFRDACSQIILSNVGHLTVNGVEIQARDIDGIAAQYQRKEKTKCHHNWKY